MSSYINPNKLNQILNLEAHFFDSVKCVAFHPTEPYFATGSNDRTAKVWRLSPNYSSATLVAILKSQQDITSVAFHPTDLILATGSWDMTVRLWRVFPDSSSATCVAILIGHSEYVTCVAFHPTGQFLVTGSWDKTVILWRLSPDNSSAIPVTIIAGHSCTVSSVAFDPTGQFLATGSWDTTVILWKLSEDNSSAICVATLVGHSHFVNCVAFDPTGRVLASGSNDKTVRLWQLSEDNSSATCMNILTGHTHNVLSVAFHPTKPLLTSSSYDGTAKVWEISSDNSSVSCVETLDSHRSPVFCVAFHPFNETLATGGFDHCTRLWRCNKMTSKSEELQQKSFFDILPMDVVTKILEQAPQLGTTCTLLHALLPKLDREENPGIRFPSVNTKPDSLVEIRHGGLTFFYEAPPNASSYNWDGLNPSIHSPARILPLSEYECDFCDKKHKEMRMKGHNIHGVLFVCPECNLGLTACLKKILGPNLWSLIETEQKIRVPRTNGPNEMWYFGSKLPLIHRGTWHLRVQSHPSLINDECISKVVPVQKLKELNEAVPP
jgi:6-phosphogluconolactonase (cycloisomerase 2 family)